ncbi:MAG: methyltransferase domain-containing protein [Acidobacteriota bacterium]
MNLSTVERLACPRCGSALSPNSDALVCGSCGTAFPIVDGIPRFVPARNYAESFGFQWNRFAQTQLDDYWGIDASRSRFAAETRWPADLRGQVILEAGCGAGRFTGHAAASGATIVSFDYSSAVEAASRTHATLENVTFLQADIYHLPLRPQSFDKIFCFGVLQHCPDPEGAFRALLPLLKPGGEIVIDVYRLSWKSLFQGKYYLRPVTRRIRPQRLFPIVQRYVRAMYPLLGLPHRIVGSRAARAMGQVVGICDYRGYFALSSEKHFELCLLDTFDMLSPAHDHPKTLATIQRWFSDARLQAVEVKPGYNGVEARGRRPQE